MTFGTKPASLIFNLIISNPTYHVLVCYNKITMGIYLNQFTKTIVNTRCMQESSLQVSE